MIVFKVRKKERRQINSDRRRFSIDEFAMHYPERRIKKRRSILDRRSISVSLIQQHNRLGGN